jgi:hypothetical protein
VVVGRLGLRRRTWALVQVEEGSTAARPASSPGPHTTRALLQQRSRVLYRNRVEQIVDVVKSHRLFAQGVYHGNSVYLFPLVAIVGHVTALELRTRQHFDTWGPWQHHY